MNFKLLLAAFLIHYYFVKSSNIEETWLLHKHDLFYVNMERTVSNCKNTEIYYW